MSPLNNMRVVGGTAKGHRLRGAVTPGVRPTSERARAAIFNVLPPQLIEDARALDLFAGTGSLGIEALSRGAAWADFVEKNRRQCQVLQANLDNTGFRDRSRAYCAEAAKALETLPGPYRLVLLDPPYKMAELGQFMELLGTTPELVEEDGVVVVGHSRHVTLDPQYGNLALTSGRRYGDNLVDFYQRGGN
ncbi:MAG: 16S rRNA (guanine(966)-N(2))-methyltransferase RsmD [Chloroflexi bacterium]|nr:16S rRNA (guanine(966)-N(2))-methyltransferase RsmD [Chloroflexota bacterium]